MALMPSIARLVRDGQRVLEILWQGAPGLWDISIYRLGRSYILYDSYPDIRDGPYPSLKRAWTKGYRWVNSATVSVQSTEWSARQLIACLRVSAEDFADVGEIEVNGEAWQPPPRSDWSLTVTELASRVRSFSPNESGLRRLPKPASYTEFMVRGMMWTRASGYDRLASDLEALAPEAVLTFLEREAETRDHPSFTAFVEEVRRRGVRRSSE